MSEAEEHKSARLVPVTPFELIVFGAAGDLSLRKLIPSLFHRWRDRQIPENSHIIGIARSPLSNTEFRQQAFEAYKNLNPDDIPNQSEWDEFAALIDYVTLDAVASNGDWSPVQDLVTAQNDKQRVFYLALPPSIYGAVCHNIARAGLKNKGARVVLEKPLGRDLKSACEINDTVGAVFDEKDIFRIDHYLGKETVQNLLVLRFMNSILEPVWNANVVNHVQITVAETLGAGERAEYYDTAGALRDMVQNHLLQLLCLIAMEPPFDLEADTVRDEKIKILRALRPVSPSSVTDSTVRGQYSRGAIEGEAVAGYTDELGRDSKTETFVALKAYIDNWRWKGVPFYLRTGKRMSARRSEIVIQFKDVAHALVESRNLKPTRLIIRLQPDEGVKLLLVTKDPGPGGMRLRYVPLNLSYADTFTARYPDAYERLLMAVIRGDLTLFMRRDEIEAAWHWVDAILASWQAADVPLHFYAAGTDGPTQAAMLLDRDGRAWFDGAHD
ncbi:MAG: glucose-6-phosphate dehydrogenase [bacterium]